MPVPAQATLFNESDANGVTTSFPYQFMIADAADITVEVDDVVVTTGFTVTGVGSPTGGAIEFAVAPANGSIILRYLDPVLKRVEDYQQLGDFNSETIDLDLDRIWLAIQSFQARVSRAIKLPVATAGDQTLMENAAERANMVIGFDQSGNLRLFAPVDNTLLAVDLANPAAGKGAALVGFNAQAPYGAGSVGAAVLDRGVCVTDHPFLASGNGVADDTAAVQAAINACAGRELILPAGHTFRCGPLTIPHGMTLRIDGTLKMRDSTGTLITVSGTTDFVLRGNGEIDLNQTEYIGVMLSDCTRPRVEGAITFRNMLGGAASTGNSGALQIINCTKPRVIGAKFRDLLHGTAPNDSQPRAISLDTSNDAVLEFEADGINTAVVAGSCNGVRIKATVRGGEVTNDNAFYIIGCSDTIINADISDWNGEPIVVSGSTDTVVLGGTQVDCTGNANGFENSNGLTFINTVFRGSSVAGILKSRSANTTSSRIELIGCVLDVSSTQEIVSFITGVVDDFKMLDTTWIVTHDTGKSFGSRFLRLVNTNRFAVERNTIIFKDGSGAAAAADFLIELACTGYSSFKQNRLINRTASGMFRVNGLDANVAADDLHKQANIDAGRNANYNLSGAEPREFWSDGAPTAGTFIRGDKVWNTGASAGGPVGWVCVTAGSPGTWAAFGIGFLSGSSIYNPPSLANGSGVTTTVTVTGAALGDVAVASFGLDLQGITVTAYVSAANTVSVRFKNESGGVLDLAQNTLRAIVFKR